MVDPDWIDPALYPFEPHFLEVDGGRMHYVDEGDGPVVVLVHGTPTWSFLFRDLIRGLAPDHRVVAPDHIGFGRSDKPPRWTYRPQDHARNLEALLSHLGVDDVTLGVHDFGGPIGLSHAVEHPERVRRLVLFNTWMWPLDDVPAARRASALFGGPLGRLLYLRFNVSPRVLLKAAYGDRRRLSRRVHRHYVDAFPTAAERQGPWRLARELTASGAWFGDLWRRRDRLAGRPVQLLWGLRDPTFGPAYLDRWRALFPDAEVHAFGEAGHFVPEEVGPGLVPLVRSFLQRT